MHVTARTASIALPTVILSAPGQREVRNRHEFSVELLTLVVASRHKFEAFICVDFVVKLDVNVSHHMIAQVVTNNYIFDFAAFADFLKHVYKEFLKSGVTVARTLLGNKGAVLASRHVDRLRVWVHTRDHYSLAEGGFVMLTLAFVSVATYAHLDVECAIYTVLLGAMNPCEASGTTLP